MPLKLGRLIFGWPGHRDLGVQTATYLLSFGALPCGYEGQVHLAAFRRTMAVRDVGLYLRCTACGRKGPETEPVWPPR